MKMQIHSKSKIMAHAYLLGIHTNTHDIKRNRCEFKTHLFTQNKENEEAQMQGINQLHSTSTLQASI